MYFKKKIFSYFNFMNVFVISCKYPPKINSIHFLNIVSLWYSFNNFIVIMPTSVFKIKKKIVKN